MEVVEVIMVVRMDGVGECRYVGGECDGDGGGGGDNGGENGGGGSVDVMVGEVMEVMVMEAVEV